MDDVIFRYRSPLHITISNVRREKGTLHVCACDDGRVAGSGREKKKQPDKVGHFCFISKLQEITRDICFLFLYFLLLFEILIDLSRVFLKIREQMFRLL